MSAYNIYYKKSLRNQNKEINEEKEILLSILKKNNIQDDETYKLDLINKAVKEYKKTGTPKKIIDTFDIPNDTKAEIYDKACIIKKGRPSKHNPYKK